MAELLRLSPTAFSELKALVTAMDNHTGDWVTQVGGDEIEPGVIEMPYTELDPIARDAMGFLYDNDLVQVFDWAKWQVGKDFFTLADESKYSTLNREWVLKLLTAVARNDRFNEGAWGNLFETGTAQKLYKRLLVIEESQQ